MFNLEQLLQPVSPIKPCGEDLTFSQELDAIARARQHDDPSLDQGEWVVALKEADWPFVATRCEQLIASHSKDLRVAVWLAEAHAKTRHFRGLGDGFTLLAGLCERYWDGLYPPIEGGDPEQRIGNLFWLLTRTPQLVREVPLTDGADAMYEHHEEWHWTTGESAVLKFATVHHVENGKITLWKDYWDMSGLTNFAPPSWLENFATADMSWIFDATGLV